MNKGLASAGKSTGTTVARKGGSASRSAGSSKRSGGSRNTSAASRSKTSNARSSAPNSTTETSRNTTADTGDQYEGSDISTGSQTPEGVTSSADVFDSGVARGGDATNTKRSSDDDV